MSRAWILLGLIAGPASATCDIDDKQQILVTHGSVGHAPQQFRTGSYSGDAFRRGLEHALKTQESALAVKNEVMALLREAMRLSTDAAERAQIQAKLSKLDPLFSHAFLDELAVGIATKQKVDTAYGPRMRWVPNPPRPVIVGISAARQATPQGAVYGLLNDFRTWRNISVAEAKARLVVALREMLHSSSGADKTFLEKKLAAVENAWSGFPAILADGIAVPDLDGKSFIFSYDSLSKGQVSRQLVRSLLVQVEVAQKTQNMGELLKKMRQFLESSKKCVHSAEDIAVISAAQRLTEKSMLLSDLKNALARL